MTKIGGTVSSNNTPRLVPGKIGFLTWGRRGRRRVNPEEVILEESPQVGLLGNSDDKDTEELRFRVSFGQEVVSLSAENRAFVFGTFRDSIFNIDFYSNQMKIIKCKMFQPYETKCNKCKMQMSITNANVSALRRGKRRRGV